MEIDQKCENGVILCEGLFQHIHLRSIDEESIKSFERVEVVLEVFAEDLDSLD